MTRQRLRPAYTPAELAEIYAKPHDSRRWIDHNVRVETTMALGIGLAEKSIQSIADLSCGNGAIARGLQWQNGGGPRLILGDFAPGYDYTGPIEATIEEIPPVDVFVCSETIEHLDDPDKVLARIRRKTRYLLLSTPIEAWGETNPEHYWAWDRDEVENMLQNAGFTTHKPYIELDMRNSWSPYCFGIWIAS